MAEKKQIHTRADTGMAILRMVTGLMMAYHGLEVFYPDKMQVYKDWEVIQKLPAGMAMVYLGKLLELITGILLTIGWLTRWAAIAMAVVMMFICFYIGKGRFWYEDQHPFLFALMALVFAVSGPGAWALDNLKKKNL